MLPAFAVTQITASGIERRVCKVQVPALDTGTRNAVETSCSLQMGVDPPPRRASAQDWPSAPILCLGVSMCILAATDTRDHAHLVAMEGGDSQTPKRGPVQTVQQRKASSWICQVSWLLLEPQSPKSLPCQQARLSVAPCCTDSAAVAVKRDPASHCLSVAFCLDLDSEQGSLLSAWSLGACSRSGVLLMSLTTRGKRTATIGKSSSVAASVCIEQS